MGKRLQKELEQIKKRVLSLCAIVEERVRMAKKSVESWDAELAGEIMKKDYEIDEIEVEIEEECLKILALHQPVAVDLRFLIAVIKINSDLERIGDEASNLAKRVDNISRRKRLDLTFDYSAMAEAVLSMLRMSIDSLVTLDQKLAFQVLSMDNDVDTMYREIYDKVKAAISERPEYVGYMINLNAISRHLERIGDHCTNIAEEVIYLIEGEIIRHAKKDRLSSVRTQ
ncbi:MAG: phosphate transport system regulatory protein PhoU [Desulfobacteraceae bacterium]|nr:MAG: phosphate transport system regulatory protein PhoU [Desulfobacteraceae bacterium]